MPASSIDFAKCILVIGATSGIGRSLAIALSNLPSKPTVIAAGRRQERLDELEKDHKLRTIQVDVNTDAVGLKKFVDETLEKYTELDAVVFCSGIQHKFDFAEADQIDPTDITAEVNVNYTSVVVMSRLFIPHFLKLHEQKRKAWIMPVSSSLAFTHPTWVPNYGATKAALHGFTASLRIQLSHTNINVIEVIPPLVESELHDAQGTTPTLSKVWMPLDSYVRETVEGLRRGDYQIPVGSAAAGYDRFERAKMDLVYENSGIRIHESGWATAKAEYRHKV